MSVTPKTIAPVICFVLFVLSPISDTTAAKSARDVPTKGNDLSSWMVRGNASVVASNATLARLTRGDSSADSDRQERMSVFWRNAVLEAEGTAPIRVNMHIDLTIGRTLPVGEHTPYPGLITILEDATGEIVELKADRKSEFRMANRGAWLGHFVHAESRGDDHLAVEIPFSLYDEKTGALIAESNLLAGFDLSNRAKPSIYIAHIDPTPFPELRVQTTDIGRAVQGQTLAAAPLSGYTPEVYDAQVIKARIRTVLAENGLQSLFDPSIVSSYNCAAEEELMQLEILSSGFSSLDETRTPGFNLQLQYSPSVVSEDDLAYLERVTGLVTFHYDEMNRVIEIGPGNHGNLASNVSIIDNSVWFELGISLREGSAAPVVARLDLRCDIEESKDGELSCDHLALTTATDPDGRTVSPASLSSLIDKPFPFSDFGLKTGGHKTEVAVVQGGVTRCPSACPTCMTEGCDQGGHCDILGAPINCNNQPSCDHTPGTSQWCRYASLRVCCVQRCATPE